MAGRTYKNYLERFGVTEAAARKRCEEIFNTIFYGSEGERVYHPVGDSMGYIEDTGNHDVRTEGMSYGMMMCVQNDKKDEFDRLWTWARTYMYLKEGPNAGYFAWSCQTDGQKNSWGAAPDGEEYFVMTLIFAGNRWGNGEGIYDYHNEAKLLLHTMANKGYDDSPGRAMFDRDTAYIRFIVDVDFTDPSYHLPHFYELYALYVEQKSDKEFFRRAAAASREYWKKACNEETGLSAEYAAYDGTPQVTPPEAFGGRHDWFYSDAYRTILNIALDSVWNSPSEWAVEEAEKYIGFFEREENREDWDHIYEVDGTKLPEGALHPVAIIATNASAGAIVQSKETDVWIRRFLETPLRLGDRRYYDNCLYFFSYMLLSGNYRIY